MARQHLARWIAGQLIRANNLKRGSSRRVPDTTSRPKRRPRDRGCGRALGDGRDACGAGNHREMELKTTTLDSRPARGDGAVEFFGCRAGLNEVFDNPYLGRIQMGDDGGRLTNGREDPGNQGWEIETLTAGPGTHSRRRNGKYR